MTKSIFCKKGNIYIKMDTDDICFAVAEGDYVSLILKNKETILLRTSLTKMEESINSDSFFRTHRSWLININEVDILDFKGEWAQIASVKIPISRTRRSDFFKKISRIG